MKYFVLAASLLAEAYSVVKEEIMADIKTLKSLIVDEIKGAVAEGVEKANTAAQEKIDGITAERDAALASANSLQEQVDAERAYSEGLLKVQTERQAEVDALVADIAAPGVYSGDAPAQDAPVQDVPVDNGDVVDPNAPVDAPVEGDVVNVEPTTDVTDTPAEGTPTVEPGTDVVDNSIPMDPAQPTGNTDALPEGVEQA